MIISADSRIKGDIGLESEHLLEKGMNSTTFIMGFVLLELGFVMS